MILGHEIVNGMPLHMYRYVHFLVPVNDNQTFCELCGYVMGES